MASFMIWSLKTGSLFVTLLVFISIYKECPFQPSLSLDETIKDVKRYSLKDFDYSIDEAVENPHGFSVMRVMDYEN